MPKQNIDHVDHVKEVTVREADESKKRCFIIMPIADTPGYAPDHFTRVYEYIIKPACINAGFIPDRADDTKNTNTIILDILNQIVNADMAICDLSSRNPNVMYELGIRQAFNLPVVLLKDDLTSRVFDTSHLRDVPYDHTLRIDTVEEAISKLTEAIEATYERRDEDTHSLIKMLGIHPAKIPEKKEIAQDTALILDAINNLNYRIDRIESNQLETPEIIDINNDPPRFQKYVGRKVHHIEYGSGVVRGFSANGILVKFENGINRKFKSPFPHGTIRFIDNPLEENWKINS